MNAPRVSLVIPVLNTRPYLGQCLESVIAQTLEDIEIICVDNGSTDGSLEMLRRFAARERRLTVIEHRGGRLGGARNAGVRCARGDYVGYVDSDDFVDSRMFDALHTAATRIDADMAVCNLIYWFPQTGVAVESLDSGWLAYPSGVTIEQEPRLLRNLTACNKLYSRSFLNRLSASFPEGIFFEDQVYVTRAYFAARRIATVKEALYYYRKQRPGSINANSGPVNLEFFSVMDLLSQALRADGVSASNSIVKELQAVRCLQLYGNTSGSARRVFYRHMQRFLRSRSGSWQSRIMSRGERRQMRVACHVNGSLYDVYLLLKGIYGGIRQLGRKPTVQVAQVACRPPTQTTLSGEDLTPS